jgi:hypothetical protein
MFGIGNSSNRFLRQRSQIESVNHAVDTPYSEQPDDAVAMSECPRLLHDSLHQTAAIHQRSCQQLLMACEMGSRYMVQYLILGNLMSARNLWGYTLMTKNEFPSTDTYFISELGYTRFSYCLDVGGVIILKWILQKRDGIVRDEFMSHSMNQCGGFCDHGNEPMGFNKSWKIPGGFQNGFRSTELVRPQYEFQVENMA